MGRRARSLLATAARCWLGRRGGGAVAPTVRRSAPGASGPGWVFDPMRRYRRRAGAGCRQLRRDDRFLRAAPPAGAGALLPRSACAPASGRTHGVRRTQSVPSAVPGADRADAGHALVGGARDLPAHPCGDPARGHGRGVFPDLDPPLRRIAARALQLDGALEARADDRTRDARDRQAVPVDRRLAMTATAPPSTPAFDAVLLHAD